MSQSILRFLALLHEPLYRYSTATVNFEIGITVMPLSDESFIHIGPAQIEAAFAVMKELRPHLTDLEKFSEQIGRQKQSDYHLVGMYDRDDRSQLIGLVGYRFTENFLYGRHVYVDDLIVTEACRRANAGAQLLKFARTSAIEAGCKHFVLDTGLHMPLAQRFYFRNGLLAKGMHFVEPLPEA